MFTELFTEPTLLMKETKSQYEHLNLRDYEIETSVRI